MFELLPVKLSFKYLPRKVLQSNSLLALAGSSLVSNAGNRVKRKLVTDDVVEKFVKEGAAVKVAGTDLAMNVSSRVLDIVGLEGMSYRYGMEKCFRDAKVTQIYEGSNQANRIDLFHGEIAPLFT